MQSISAIVPTYIGDDAEELAVSLRSLSEQTRRPDEIVIVEDGPITGEQSQVLADFENVNDISVRRIKHGENLGHGTARRTGIQYAKYDLIAIHDADDISVPERLEWSIQAISTTDADAIGGFVEEFESDPSKPYAIREVPCNPRAIRKLAKIRSPMNHTTVLAKRDAILDAGNYRKVGQMEDYELWARMLVNGSVLSNIPRVLAKVRAGEDFYERRGGVSQVSDELRLQRHFVNVGFISRRRALINVFLRSLPKLAPNIIRKHLYQRIFRE